MFNQTFKNILDVLAKDAGCSICATLNCDICDVMEFVPNTDKEEKQNNG